MACEGSVFHVYKVKMFEVSDKTSSIRISVGLGVILSTVISVFRLFVSAHS